MQISGFLRALAVGALVATLGACATAPTPYDYSAFKQSRPKTLLVLPALNHSPEVNAGVSVMSRMSYPLAEAGYYVLPVTLVTETFRQNGLDNAEDIQAVAAEKLREIFGADAARSEEHTSELQSLMRISYAVFCLKKKNNNYTL